MKQPTKRIFDPSFKYTMAAATDIRKTFARVRREQAAAAKLAVVTPLEPRKGNAKT